MKIKTSWLVFNTSLGRLVPTHTGHVIYLITESIEEQTYAHQCGARPSLNKSISEVGPYRENVFHADEGDKILDKLIEDFGTCTQQEFRGQDEQN